MGVFTQISEATAYLAVYRFGQNSYLFLQISSSTGILIPGNDTPVLPCPASLPTDLLLMQHLGV